MKTKLRRNNILLQGGDQVFIASRSQLVTVTGEVNNPGKKLFLKGKRLNYYIKHSGGYTKDADKKAIWVTHVDGKSKRHKRSSVFSQKLYDSSVINVGKKKEEEPLDKTELAKEIASIIADFAQVISLVLIAK